MTKWAVSFANEELKLPVFIRLLFLSVFCFPYFRKHEKSVYSIDTDTGPYCRACHSQEGKGYLILNILELHVAEAVQSWTFFTVEHDQCGRLTWYKLKFFSSIKQYTKSI